ncbi:major capsid protein [Gordonia sp. (in: high G+C Gram-positive bacteria)]|uniref:major capsid protein n=1 Tax=Gordonia sp. (in: high G+C Gram-positive bacteria) TaxID=84139 RepID=UPI001DED881A|nr:major capsid protein [Gordonia sp. (in: high G+C Gram-positive bacteria)]MCB1294283.1 major capsid protein [Gordonia sp. (in: high G+C Gram-positive bacteria)]HMS77212.1 major capsid protein [Gordonia sp. (in: high G+C Gram-positive bacteria)]
MADLDLQALLDVASGDTPAQRQEAVVAALTEAGVTGADVVALLDEVADRFGALVAAEPEDAESVLGLELLADVADAAQRVQTDLVAESARVREVRDDLAARVLSATTTADPEPGAVEDLDTEAPAEVVDTVDDEPAAGVDAPAEPEPAATVDAPAEPVAVAAAATGPRRRFNLGRIAAKAPAPVRPEQRGPTITAAGNLHDHSAGDPLTVEEMIASAADRLNAMPTSLRLPNGELAPRAHGEEAVTIRHRIAQIHHNFPSELVASGKNDDDVIAYAVDQSNLPGGSLTAGGWCAPSDRLWDLLPSLSTATEGMVNVPEIAVTHGGIITMGGLSFRTVWAGNAGIFQTEAQAIANTEKVFFRPTCPGDTETRLDVVYSGIVVDNLQDHAFPATTKQAVEEVTSVHAHRINASTIARMVAASTPHDMSAAVGPSATASVLNGLELVITNMRYGFRAPKAMWMDVVMPDWVHTVLRSDLALRTTADGNPNQVSDAQIDAFFAVRKARVQWVYDWQDAFTGVPSGFGAVTPITAFPTTVNALVYPAGTFVRGRGPIVNLDSVYDSQNTKVNDYLRLFMEEKLLVHKRGYESLNVTLPLGVRGAAAAAQVLVNGGVPA